MISTLTYEPNKSLSDRDNFQSFYLSNKGSLDQIIGFKLGPLSKNEDIKNEILYRLYKDKVLTSYRSEKASLNTYITLAVSYRVLQIKSDYLQKKKTFSRGKNRVTMDLDFLPNSSEHDYHYSPLLKKGRVYLSDKDNAVLDLLLKGCTNVEISKKYDVSPQYVHFVVSRIKKTLFKHLKESFYEERVLAESCP